MISILASKLAPEAQSVVINMLLGTLSDSTQAQEILLSTVRAQAEGELHVRRV